MLIFVKPFSLLPGMESECRPAINVIIVSFNVCIGVMQDIMLDLPKENISPQEVHRIPHKIVQPFLV